MDEVLQGIAAVFYLLQKIFLSLAERARYRKADTIAQHWRVVSWIVYLIGLPAWVIIFVFWHNWIAAFVEASGLPAMLLGLVIAWRGSKERSPPWLTRIAWVCAGLGLLVSLYDFGGMRTFNQWLEVILSASFLIGTLQLAHGHAMGYLWYVLMHVACGWLMWIQGYPWLFAQQIASLIFILDAYLMSRRHTSF